jgi:hypothetical protein
MNADQPMTEKEFRSILGRLQNYEDERIKLINEIDSILDRLCRNRKPTDELKSNLSSPTDQDDAVIPMLQLRLRVIDVDNGKLKAISNRLNELI